MLRKLFIAGALLFGIMSVQAQENNGVMLIGHSAVKLSEKQLKKCEALMKDAQWYLKRKEFGKAKEKLRELVAINPKDAQAKVLLDQCEKNTAQYGESADKKPNKFSLGITAGMDFFKLNYGIHFGLAARYGHYTDLVNITAGLEFEVHQSYHGRDDVLETVGNNVTLGGQAIIPVLVKFNLVKVTNATRFYAGAGAELGIKLYAKDINDYSFVASSSKVPLMNPTTIAGLVQVGITGRHFDAGIYYRHYFTDLVNRKFPSYQESERIGFSATYYF